MHYLPFRIRNVTVTTFLLALLCTIPLTKMPAANAVVDPWSSLHPTDTIPHLHQMRLTLASNPQDQVALGHALMDYVNLMLTGDPSQDGIDGPWLTYAQQLAHLRKIARNNGPWTSLADAAPELWLQLLTGDRLAVAQSLQQWDKFSDEPHYRALYALATGDWRSFKANPPTTLHERYAAVRVGFEMKIFELADALKDTIKINNPSIHSLMVKRMNRYLNHDTLLTDPLAMTTWLLASSEVADEKALPYLQSLHAILFPNSNQLSEKEVNVPRRQLWQRVYTEMLELDSQIMANNNTAEAKKHAQRFAQLFATCYNICEELSTLPGAIFDKGNHLSLYTIGDLARWNRSRLMRACTWGFSTARSLSFEERDRSIFAQVRELAPNSIVAARLSLGRQVSPTSQSNDKPDPQRWDEYSAALLRELKRPHGMTIPELSSAIRRLANMKPGKAKPIYQHITRTQTQLLARPGFEDFYEGVEASGVETDYLSSLQALSEIAPSDPVLREYFSRWLPDYRLYETEFSKRKPAHAWTDAVIDHPKLPKPETKFQKKWFSIIWSGQLTIDQPGEYTIAVESDDAFQLVIGSLVLSKKPQRGRSTVALPVTMAAGTYDVHFEYEHLKGDALCRLLWQAPGDKQLTPIPAARLSNTGDPVKSGATKPGLFAFGYNFARGISARRIYNEREKAAALATPWDLGLWGDIADSLSIYSNWDTAIPYYRHVINNTENNSKVIKLAICYLYDHPEQPDEVLTLAKRFPEMWNHYEIDDFASCLWNMYKLNKLDEFVSAFSSQHRYDEGWKYGFTLQALSKGELESAYKHMLTFLGRDSHGQKHFPVQHFRFLFQHHLVLKRIFEPQIDWVDLRKQYQNGSRNDFADLVIDWLSGEVAWENCVARIPEVTDGDVLLYVRAWVDLTTGHHDEAKKGFANTLARHPTWLEAPICRHMLTWYEQQTPESLARLPQAKPVTPSPGVKSPAKPGANDF